MTTAPRSQNKQKGMALVEVLVASGILAAIVLGGLSLSDYLVSTSKYSDRRNGLSSLEMMIIERLNDPDLCVATIGNMSGIINVANNTVANDIQLKIPNLRGGPNQDVDILSKNEDIRPLRLRVSTLEFSDVSAIDGTYYLGHLSMAVQDDKGQNYKKDLLAAVIFKRGPGNVITECHSNSMLDSAEVCGQITGCNYDATQTPHCKCAKLDLQKCAGGAWSYPVFYDFNPAPGAAGVPECKSLSATCTGNTYVTSVSLTGGACGLVPAPPPGAVPLPSTAPVATTSSTSTTSP